MSEPRMLILPEKVHDDAVSILTNKGESTSCWGRSFSCGGCISKNAVFVIATVTGLAILILGLLALAGCFAPQTAGMGQMLQQIKEATIYLATQLGTKAHVIAILGTSVGLALTFSGLVGSAVEKCKRTIQTSTTASLS